MKLNEYEGPRSFFDLNDRSHRFQNETCFFSQIVEILQHRVLKYYQDYLNDHFGDLDLFYSKIWENAKTFIRFHGKF